MPGRPSRRSQVKDAELADYISDDKLVVITEEGCQASCNLKKGHSTLGRCKAAPRAGAGLLAAREGRD
jgi:hypothetical protein